MTEDQPSPGLPSPEEPDPSDLATQAESAAMRGIAALEDALAGWERYEVLGFLAQGGMGRVYKARDPRLGRLVALKFIVSDSFAAAQRFSQEAQAQARVEHEAVCRIYEVGVWSGQPYIALQFIDGLPLGEAVRGLSVEEKAGLVRRVAEGLHAAHRLGLIHRDIKTTNIMVERGQDGLLHPYLMDFGLARAQEGPGLTQTGLIMGTPAFMAPEQARGDAGAVDRRSDIYSLGATLYEVLTGRLPFDARTSADVIVAILTEDPSPLRRLVPGLPQDLDSIVMKCLEKDPARRYDSAQALADDLGRFLDGLPVQARQIGRLQRLERSVRRHPAASALVAGSAVLALGFGAWGLRTSLRAKAQAALAQSFGQEAEQIDAILRYGHLLPLHDLRTEKAMVRERMASITARMAKAGSVAEAPGRAALGRGHLALGELAWARRELERAWVLGHRTPEAEHALGRALAGLYQRALAEARKLPDPAARARRKQTLVAELRDPALRHLQAGRSLSGISAYTEGLMALQEERFAEALGKARAAAGQLPWFYEAVALEGQIWAAQALTEAERGDYARALDSSRKAEEAFDRAFATARSDGSLLLGKAGAILVELAALVEQGRPTEAPYRRAQAVLAEARKTDPDRAENHHLEARIHWLRASDLDSSGGDGREALKASIGAAETALRLDPEDTQAYERLANACWFLSQQETGRGGDGAPALAKAEAAAKRGLALDATVWGLHRSLGVVHGIRAEAHFRQGLDPAPALEASVAAFREAIARNPEGTQIFGNLANALFLVAEMKGDRGEDPQPALQEAEAALARALALNPELTNAWDERGKLRFRQALHRFEQGQDPRPDLEAALGHLDAALKRNPAMPQAWVHRAEALLLKAQYERETGLDPGPSLAEAERASRRAREIIRDYGEIVAAFVDILQLKAELLALDGRAYAPVLAEARRALEAAVARDATSPFMWERRAAIDLLAARLDGSGPGPLLEAAELHLAKAESLGTPTHARRNLRARLSLAKARHAPRAADKALAEGLEALDLSLKANPSQAEGRALRAALLMARARRQTDPAFGARDREEARREYETALRANPLVRREAAPWMTEGPLPARAPRP